MPVPSTGYDLATPDNPAGVIDWSAIVDLSNMSASWWAAVDTSDGTKGRVYLDAGPTEMACDWIDFDNSGQTGFVRFYWASMPASGTNSVRVYPPNTGNASVAAGDTYGSDNAYRSDCEGDWPDGGGTDRTANGNDGTGSGGITIGGAAGKIGKATDFDGSNDYVTLGATGIPEGSSGQKLTVCYWAQFDAVSSDRLMAAYASASDGWRSRVEIGQSWFRTFGGNDGGAGNSLSADGATWYHLVQAWDVGADVETFQNGSSINTAAVTDLSSVSGGHLILGGQDGDGDGVPEDRFHDGRLSQVQIYSGLMSGDWVAQEYSFTNDNAAAWTTWTWQAAGGGSYESSVSFGASAGITPTAAAAALASMAAGGSLGAAILGTAGAQATMAAGASAGDVLAATAAAVDAVTASIAAAISGTAVAAAVPTLVLDAELGYAVVAAAAAAAGLSSEAVAGIAVAGSTVVANLVTPDGRTFTVTVTGRTMTVPASDRSFKA